MVTGAILLFASALLHASWNAVLKREHDPQLGMLGVLVSGLAFSTACAVAWPGVGFQTRAAVAWAVGAGVFEGFYFATLSLALARATYGAVYAIARGGALVVVWPAAAWLLSEPFTARSASGAALVAVGVVLVAVSSREHSSPRGVAFAMACAGSIAGYHLCYSRALSQGAGHAPLFALALAVALPFAFLSVRSGLVLHAPRGRDLWRWSAAGAVLTASFLLFLAGLARSGAGTALTLRNTSVVFAQLLAVMMGEAMPLRQLSGAVLVVVGAALVATH
jgi:drug/metabolite transporter (DMT)-like permease